MSGVWIFDKNGVARLITNPTRESFEQKEPPYPGTATSPGARPRVLVYLPANQVIRSYTQLEHCLTELGWSRYHNSSCPNLLQFHRANMEGDSISHIREIYIFEGTIKDTERVGNERLCVLQHYEYELRTSKKSRGDQKL
ncbi:hypothetical protein SO802_018232 [Lithocarpus litseifolius]|uniref:Flowering-promoting factor 1-like protein 1 n=1 Tax=Lithocarpus litseifolius TaxID=425828 RepID=A0AAW2CPH4_9ROSI